MCVCVFLVFLDPLLTREFGLVRYIFLIDFCSGTIGCFGKIEVHKEGSDEYNCSKEAETSRKRIRTSDREKSTDNSRPEPVRESSQTVCFTTFSHGEHFRTYNPNDWYNQNKTKTKQSSR